MTKDKFDSYIKEIQQHPEYRQPAAYGIGLARYRGTELLDMRFLTTNIGEEDQGTAAALHYVLYRGESSAEGFKVRGDLMPGRLERLVTDVFAWCHDDMAAHANAKALSRLKKIQKKKVPKGSKEASWRDKHGRTVKPFAVFIYDLNDEPRSAEDVWLRLHLLSQRKIRPHDANLDGAFGLLTNVAWTNLGPFTAHEAEALQMKMALEGKELQIRSIDKFPRMTDYVVPSGVRIGDANRVRLGAHLAPDTTVMHEGFVNFNAGTLGKSMMEGRISAGVVVGDGTDISGGASIMGTLSGGGKEVISVGEGRLLGANSGIGISLGANCVVEAGLYLTAGTKVTNRGLAFGESSVLKASELSGRNNLLFRRDSVSGAVEVRLRDETEAVVLNAELHTND